MFFESFFEDESSADCRRPLKSTQKKTSKNFGSLRTILKSMKCRSFGSNGLSLIEMSSTRTLAHSHPHTNTQSYSNTQTHKNTHTNTHSLTNTAQHTNTHLVNVSSNMHVFILFLVCKSGARSNCHILSSVFLLLTELSAVATSSFETYIKEVHLIPML